jgi:nucleotide-binding universal stress UspA family protein
MPFNTEGRIVVGIDGSVESLAALRWSLRYAVKIGAPVEVVHCWHPSLLTDALGSAHELHRGSICMLANEVSAALAELPRAPEVRKRSRCGRPARLLPKLAADAQLLVLGAHRHPARGTVILGRVARSCLLHETCPVVIVDHLESIVEHTAPAGHRPGAPSATSRAA